MSQEQRNREFIEANLGLLHKFMRRHRLSDDYYGLLAISYISAANQYLSSSKLQRYAFTTVLYYRLRYTVAHARRKELREPITIPLELAIEPSSIDAESEKMLWESLKQILTPRQYEVLYLRYWGKTNREIAEQLCISQVAVERLFSRIRKRISRHFSSMF